MLVNHLSFFSAFSPQLNTKKFNTILMLQNLCKHFPAAIKVDIPVNQISALGKSLNADFIKGHYGYISDMHDCCVKLMH